MRHLQSENPPSQPSQRSGRRGFFMVSLPAFCFLKTLSDVGRTGGGGIRVLTLVGQGSTHRRSSRLEPVQLSGQLIFSSQWHLGLRALVRCWKPLRSSRRPRAVSCVALPHQGRPPPYPTPPPLSSTFFLSLVNCSLPLFKREQLRASISSCSCQLLNFLSSIFFSFYCHN